MAEHVDRSQRLPPLLGAEREHLTDGAARPLLLVDIDGVLHPFGAFARPEGFVEYGLDVVPGDDPVWLAAQHGEWLRELARDFEMAWVTGWAQDPNLLCPLLGIDPMLRVPMPEIPFDPELKVDRVASFVGDRCVAWVDDALGPAARRSATARTAPTARRRRPCSGSDRGTRGPAPRMARRARSDRVTATGTPGRSS